LKIAIATARFKANKSEAISKNIVNLSEGLVKKGHYVTCFVTEDFHSEFNIKNVTYRKAKSYKSLFESLINLIKMCLSLRLNNQYDIFNVHIASPIELIIINLMLPRSIKEKTIITINQTFLSFFYFRKNKKEIIFNLGSYWYFIVFNSFVLSWAYGYFSVNFKSVIVNSKYQLNTLLEMGVDKSKLHIVHPSVFEGNIKRKKINIGNKLKIVHIGHNKKIKGIDAIFSMGQLLKRKGIRFELTICISDYSADSKKQIKRKIDDAGLTDNIVLKGIVNVHDELLDKDIFILPLRTCLGTTMLPNSLIEAISVGVVPCLTYHEELSMDIDYSKLLTFNSYNIDEVFYKFIGDKNKQDESCEWMHDVFTKKFNLTEYINKYITIFEREL
jgi:glycosyltransferase involved in cell wall biosynthesis